MNRLLGFVIVVAVGAGCKGDPETCEKAVRNYATLVYWEEADAQIAAAPADQREMLKKAKLGLFERKMSEGINLLVSQCVSANNDDQVDCMINAKTAAEAKACAD